MKPRLVPLYKKSDQELLARLEELLDMTVARIVLNSDPEDRQTYTLSDPLFQAIIREKARLIGIFIPVGYEVKYDSN